MLRFIRFLYYFFIFFIIYNTLIPFNLVGSAVELQANFDNTMWIPFFREGHLVSLTDIFGNILLFMPFGFLGYILRKEKGKGLLFFAVTVSGFGLSLFVETTQLFFIGRVTSVHDLITNTLGTFLGAFTAGVYFRLFADRVFGWLKYFLQKEQVTLIVVIILMAQVFGSVIPFNVTITVSDLKKSLRKTNVQPLGYKSMAQVLGLSKLKKKEYGSFSWIDFAGNVLYFTIYGYLVFLSFFLYWKRNPWALIKLAIFLAVAFPAIELMQFFIKSRITDINDIIAGYSGGLLGGLLILPFKNTIDNQDNVIPSSRLFFIPIGLYFFYLLYSGLSPFNFTSEQALIAKNFQARYLIPFLAYFRKTSIWNLYDILETLLITVPIGITLKIMKPSLEGRQLAIFAVFVSTCFALLIELCQLYLPQRTADITDVFLYASGGYLGVLAIYWYNNELLPQFTATASGAKEEQSSPVQQPT